MDEYKQICKILNQENSAAGLASGGTYESLPTRVKQKKKSNKSDRIKRMEKRRGEPIEKTIADWGLGK